MRGRRRLTTLPDLRILRSFSIYDDNNLVAVPALANLADCLNLDTPGSEDRCRRDFATGGLGAAAW